MSKTVLIVDDHPAIRASIRIILEAEGYLVIAESADGVDCLRKIRELSPDITILDISINGLDGLGVLDRANTEKLASKFLIYTSQAVENYAARCMRGGALGFVSKNTELNELLKAVSAIELGYLYFPKDTLLQGLAASESSDRADNPLTDREIAVVKYLAQGWSNIEIAEKLFLSNKTVSSHKVRIMRKLQLKSTIELADYAKRINLI